MDIIFCTCDGRFSRSEYPHKRIQQARWGRKASNGKNCDCGQLISHELRRGFRYVGCPITCFSLQSLETPRRTNIRIE